MLKIKYIFKVDKVDKVEIRSIKSKNKVENILDV